MIVRPTSSGLVYYTSVNLQFTKLEYAYNYMECDSRTTHTYTYIYIYIYFAQCCTVYVGLAQVHPNDNISLLLQ